MTATTFGRPRVARRRRERLRLFERARPMALAMARQAHQARPFLEFDDLAQEALLRLWVATRDFSGHRSARWRVYARWCVWSALSRSGDRRRTAGKRLRHLPRAAGDSSELLDGPGPGPGPDGAAELAEFGRAAWPAVARLPAWARAGVTAVARGRFLGEAAAPLGTSQQVLGRHRQQGLAVLRVALAGFAP
jgi:RNA polymerase sigma factor (sigma-70 family)